MKPSDVPKEKADCHLPHDMSLRRICGPDQKAPKPSQSMQLEDVELNDPQVIASVP